jgi:outer membrane lipoprotein-sorting protein
MRAKAESHMAGRRQAIVINSLPRLRGRIRVGAALVSGLLAAGSIAAAQTVPLPPPAPKQRNAAPPAPVPPASIPQTQGDAATPPPSGGPSAWLDHLFGSRPSQPLTDASAFDPAQRSIVNKVSTYLTNVQMLSGNFVQIGPDGRKATGHLYILKPGKVRFEYDPPSVIDIVADGQSVVVRDRRLGTQDTYPLSQTPLRFLLSDRIDLMRDTNVVGVTSDDAYATVVIEEKQKLIGSSRLAMMFDARDLKLKQWIITDPQGLDTTVAVSNLDSTKRPDPDLFRIDYTHYIQ